jgi:hypothetical protein
MLNQFFRFVLGELSAGNFFQNVGFYTLLILFAWVIKVQFKQKSGRYKIN